MTDTQGTAKRLLNLHAGSSYTPEERATDNAFAYKSHEEGRKFWVEVLDAIYQIKKGETT